MRREAGSYFSAFGITLRMLLKVFILKKYIKIIFCFIFNTITLKL